MSMKRPNICNKREDKYLYKSLSSELHILSAPNRKGFGDQLNLSDCTGQKGNTAGLFFTLPGIIGAKKDISWFKPTSGSDRALVAVKRCFRT
jgi:hypothetical protein